MATQELKNPNGTVTGVGRGPVMPGRGLRRRRAGHTERHRAAWDTVRLSGERILFGVALIGLWQMVVSLHLIDRSVTSRPADVGKYLGHAIGSSVLWTNLGATMKAVVIAFALASAVGIVVGIALALLPRVERVVAPYLDAANAMPRIALAPVFVVAFGLTINAKVALAFSIVVFIMITAARAGVRSTDVEIMRLATVLGANRRQMFTKVLFPVAIPSIFGGLRLAIIYSLLGVVTSELISAKDGVGQLLQQYTSLFQIDRVWGLLIILAVVAAVLNLLMSRVERYLLRWQPPQ
jgi:NitT/TauT family transport system permease protein